MAQGTVEMTADAAAPDVALAKAPGATAPSRNRKGRFVPASSQPPEYEEALEAEYHDLLEDVEPGLSETPEDEEAEHTEPAGGVEPAVPGRAALTRVTALLQEALRLGQQYNLVRQLPDGTLEIAGQSRRTPRETSDCTCPQCSAHAQQHWWCMVCNSGPHDWMSVKPQYERQTLKPGGIEGVRHAACSAQCARDYLSGLNRQPSGLTQAQQQTIDPTLGLPGA